MDNRKIAKNTILLYVRMLLILAVSLYTSRVVLEVLGIEDYGIYNLIAGFVTFLAFISNALVASMQRFFNVALGEDDISRYKAVFSMSINILLLFCVLVIIAGETIGLWFVKHQLDIPSGRIAAALWVYQISVFTFIANALRTPFHASIIANESMSFYAYISIFEVILRLVMVFSLAIIPADSLIMYAALYGSVIVLIDIVYIFYCRKRFEGCHYAFKWDRGLFFELFSFSGWSLLGQSAVVVRNQGEAILINRFFSVVANAAMGVASQVTSAIEMFVTNFQIAFNPQLTQTFAKGEIKQHYSLMNRSAKFSYFLLLLLMVPVVYNIDCILSLWLKEVPQYTREFCIIILFSYLINALSTPASISIMATGRIKQYELIHTFVFVFGLLMSFVLLKIGLLPYYVAVSGIIVQCLLLAIRLFFCIKETGYSFQLFLAEVIRPVMIVSLPSFIIPYLLSFFTGKQSLLLAGIDVLVCILFICFLGMTNAERGLIKDYIARIIIK